MAGRGVTKLSLLEVYRRVHLYQLKKFLQNPNGPLSRHLPQLTHLFPRLSWQHYRNRVRLQLGKFIDEFERRYFVMAKSPDADGTSSIKAIGTQKPTEHKKLIEAQKPAESNNSAETQKIVDAKATEQLTETKAPIEDEKAAEIKKQVYVAEKLAEIQKLSSEAQKPGEAKKKKPKSQRKAEKHIAEAMQRIKSFEQEILILREMKPYANMSTSEFCELRPHKADLIPHESKPLFWPHLQEDQEPGPVGRPEMGEESSDIFVFGGAVGENVKMDHFGGVVETHIPLKAIIAEAERVERRLAELRTMKSVKPKTEEAKIQASYDSKLHDIEIEQLEATLVGLKQGIKEGKIEEEEKNKIRETLAKTLPSDVHGVKDKLAVLRSVAEKPVDKEARMRREVEIELLESKLRELKLEEEKVETRRALERAKSSALNILSRTLTESIKSRLAPEQAELIKRIQELEARLAQVSKRQENEEDDAGDMPSIEAKAPGKVYRIDSKGNPITQLVQPAELKKSKISSTLKKDESVKADEAKANVIIPIVETVPSTTTSENPHGAEHGSMLPTKQNSPQIKAKLELATIRPRESKLAKTKPTNVALSAAQPEKSNVLNINATQPIDLQTADYDTSEVKPRTSEGKIARETLSEPKPEEPSELAESAQDMQSTVKASESEAKLTKFSLSAELKPTELESGEVKSLPENYAQLLKADELKQKAKSKATARAETESTESKSDDGELAEDNSDEGKTSKDNETR